ncbi:MAG: PaaI family thioesterase [Vulcanimicrobiaceae bacterium]
MIITAPFHQWLGLELVDLTEAQIDLRIIWREEYVVNPEGRYTHGGILAAFIDLAADWAIAAKFGRGVPTVDMRVDYHKVAMPGDLWARGKVLKLGRTFSSAEAVIYDMEGATIASGRGVYLTPAAP